MVLAEILSDVEYWQSLCLLQVEHSRFHSLQRERSLLIPTSLFPVGADLVQKAFVLFSALPNLQGLT